MVRRRVGLVATAGLGVLALLAAAATAPPAPTSAAPSNPTPLIGAKGADAAGTVERAQSTAFADESGSDTIFATAAGAAQHGTTRRHPMAQTAVALRATAQLRRYGDCPWLDPATPVATRVRELVRAMTPRQEAALLHLMAYTPINPYEGWSPAIPQLCIPEINEQDGAAGVGNGYTRLPDVSHGFAGATQLPAPIADAAAFDPALAHTYGGVIGSQDAAKGIDVALAPTVNIDRSPLWGRAYESLGEDPYLTASLGVPIVEGIQANRVVSVLKHFAVYNQERGRGTRADDAIVSDRAMREIYLPAFSAVVTQAHPGGIMCSYNLINGTPACQDLSLLVGILRQEWGFAGFVRSDCGSIFAQAPSMAAGVSQVKCTPLYSPAQMAAAVASGTLPRATLDALAEPLLRVLFTYNLIAAPHPQRPDAPVDTAAGQTVALQTDDEGTVLLKNSPPSAGGARLLPLRMTTLRSLALIGARDATPMPAGFGAMHVRDSRPETVLAALESRLGSRLRYTSGSRIDAAVDAARAAQVAVVVVSDVEREGHDRTSLFLPGNQDALIAAVEHANPRTIVVLETGSAVLMPWLTATPAVLETWYPGEVAGTSLVQVLSGEVDPSGKLPVTFPASNAARPDATAATFGGVGGRTDYAEGIDVGYRWYQVHDVTPAFSFGYGLSYTSFRFSGLHVAVTHSGAVTVRSTITNTGTVTGADTVQAYVGDPPSTGEPPRQLRGYQRVQLAPGATARVNMTVAPGDLGWWDTATTSWQVTAGRYQIWVGDGSDLANLPLHASVAHPATSLGPNSGPAPVPGLA